MTTGRQAVAISALLMLANLFMAVFIFADTKLKARARSSRLRLSQLLAKGKGENDLQTLHPEIASRALCNGGRISGDRKASMSIPKEAPWW